MHCGYHGERTSIKGVIENQGYPRNPGNIAYKTQSLSFPNAAPCGQRPSSNEQPDVIVIDTNMVSELMRPMPEPAVMMWFSGQDSAEPYLTVVSEGELRAGTSAPPPALRCGPSGSTARLHPRPSGVLTRRRRRPFRLRPHEGGDAAPSKTRTWCTMDFTKRSTTAII